MVLQNWMMLDYKASYEKMKRAQVAGDGGEIVHATGNFLTCGQTIGRLVPGWIIDESDWPGSD